MYAVKTEPGKERIRVRSIGSGFLPSYTPAEHPPGTGRRLIVPGYIFTLVKTAGALQVPADEWEIIEALSNPRRSTIGPNGKILSGPLSGLDNLILRTNKESGTLLLRANLLGETNEYQIRCEISEKEPDSKGETKMTEKPIYTQEQIQAALKKADEVGVRQAGEELSISWQQIARWKKNEREKIKEQEQTFPSKGGNTPAQPGPESAAEPEPEPVKTAEQPKSENTERHQSPASLNALQIENAVLKEQVSFLTSQVSRLKKAFSELI